MDYPYACWRKNSTDVLIMSLLNKMIYYNTAVFCLRYESHANIGHRANARRRPKRRSVQLLFFVCLIILFHLGMEGSPSITLADYNVLKTKLSDSFLVKIFVITLIIPISKISAF